MPILTPRNRPFASLLAPILALTLALRLTQPPRLTSSSCPPGSRRAHATAIGPTPAFAANIDLGHAGTYRYSPAFVVPYYFDDEGEFNLVWNQDVDAVRVAYTSPARRTLP